MAHPTSTPRRRHPAQRARRVVATASVAALCGLGGFLAAQSTAGGTTTADHGSTTTDDGARSSDHSGVDDHGAVATDPWGSGDRWSAQASSGATSSASSSRTPDATSRAS
jgi:hypothetical protein